MDQKSRLLTPLIVAAAASVVAFSSIGIAAITGHLPIAQSSLNPFSVLAGTPAMNSTRIVLTAAETTHRGLTRNAGEAPDEGKPVDFRPGAPLPARKAGCPDCGVVDSIKPHDTKKNEDSAALLKANYGTSAQTGREPRYAVSFVVTVRMENGTMRTIHENQRPPFSIGERVKLVNGSVIPLG